MFPSDYSQFLESEGEIIGYLNASKESKKAETSRYMYHQTINSQHDLVYSQFTQIITKRLISQPYPKQFHHFNPFCPICLKFVKNSQLHTTCFINNQRNYLIHQDCLKKDKSYEFRNIGQIMENSFVIEKISSNLFKNEKGFDFRAFYIQINFLHPINQKSFLKINKKMAPNKNKFKIMVNQSEQNSYFPNIILLPLTDFNINISIYEMDKKGSHAKFTKYLSLKNIKQKNSFIIKSQSIVLQAEIIQNMPQKERIISQMNYKYKYDVDLNIPLLRIKGFHITLPESLLEESSSDQEFIIDSSSNIVEQLLMEKQESNSTIKTSQASSPRKKNYAKNNDLNKSFQSTNQNEKINIQKLIYTNTLIDYVKNNTQSRVFQNYLAECEPQEIQVIILHIKPKLVQLITHQYGNYMVQKLFKVCSPYQRLDLLQTILPSLNDLVRNKQGTHTIQAFIQNFTLNQEYAYVVLQIMNEYYELCRNNNSTHFIQKIVKTFPFQYTITFFQYTSQNLIHFALDKNAMCVIKHMMRRMRQLEGIDPTYDQAIELIKRQIVINVTFNVDRLIMDSYGNYVIQFCYELFDLEKCAGITERILSRFFFYSLGKFSSNVLIKCISSHWIDKTIYKTLRALNNNQIVEIFRNKDGNKVLLEIMERLQGLQLWDILYSILIQIQPARYYHDRWGVCLGSRSGQVGSKLYGFPESKKKNFVRKP